MNIGPPAPARQLAAVLRTARSIKTDVSDALLETVRLFHVATHLVEMALRAPAKQEMRRQAGVGSPPKGPKRDASPGNASPAAQRAAAAGGTGWLSPDEKAKVEEERVRLEAEAAEVQRQAEEERKQKAEAQRKEEENRKAEMKRQEEQEKQEAEEAARLAALREAEESRRRELEAVERKRRAEEERKRRAIEHAEQEEARKVTYGRHGSFESLNKLRESTLPQAAFDRFMVVEQNRQLAEQVKGEKDELLMLKDENAAIWMERGRERARERMLREKRSTRLKKEMQERSRGQARAARKLQEAGRRLLIERQRRIDEEMREKVLLEKALAAKREAEQKALAAQRTRENNGHEEVMRELAAFRKRMRKENQQRAAQVRDGTPTSPGTHVVREMLHLPQGNEVRSAERLWRHVRERRESAYLENARDTREKALTQRQRTKEALAERLSKRKVAAEGLRTVNQVVAQERSKVPSGEHPHRRGASRTVTPRRTFRSKFATKEEADLFDRSPWFQLTSWFRGPLPGTSPPKGSVLGRASEPKTSVGPDPRWWAGTISGRAVARVSPPKGGRTTRV